MLHNASANYLDHILRHVNPLHDYTLERNSSDVEKNAWLHLCIDVQKKYKYHMGHTKKYWEQMKSNIYRFSNALKQLEVETAYILFSPNLDDHPSGIGPFKESSKANLSYLAEFPENHSDLTLPNDALIGYKQQIPAIESRGICDYITNHGYKGLILSGINEASPKILHKGWMHTQCVTMTARYFNLVGYATVISAECTNLGIENTDEYVPLSERIDVHKKYGIEIQPIAEILSRHRKLNARNLCVARRQPKNLDFA